MLVSQDNLVEVHGDGYLIVLEVAQPRALRANGIAQQRQNLHQRNGNRLGGVSGFGQSDVGFAFVGTAVDTKLG